MGKGIEKEDSEFFNINGALYGEPLVVDYDLIDTVIFLPDEYLNFCYKCDGFAFNGIEIFSVEEETVTENWYTLPDITSWNEAHNRYYKPIDNEILVVGRGDEDLYIYDYNEKLFKIVDRIDFMVYDDFTTFEDMMIVLLAERGFPISKL